MHDIHETSISNTGRRSFLRQGAWWLSCTYTFLGIVEFKRNGKVLVSQYVRNMLHVVGVA